MVTEHGPERLLKYFDFSAEYMPLLEVGIRDNYKGFAYDIVAAIPPTPERTVALRNLLDSMNACVRAAHDTGAVDEESHRSNHSHNENPRGGGNPPPGEAWL